LLAWGRYMMVRAAYLRFRASLVADGIERIDDPALEISETPILDTQCCESIEARGNTAPATWQKAKAAFHALVPITSYDGPGIHVHSTCCQWLVDITHEKESHTRFLMLIESPWQWHLIRRGPLKSIIIMDGVCEALQQTSTHPP